MSPTVVITGAFSNTGAAAARELQQRGWTVKTLTNRPVPTSSDIEAAPLRDDLLVSHTAPRGTGNVEAWLLANASEFGHSWTNDASERFARRAGKVPA